MIVFHGVTLYWHCQHQSDTVRSAGEFASAESVLPENGVVHTGNHAFPADKSGRIHKGVFAAV